LESYIDNRVNLGASLEIKQSKIKNNTNKQKQHK